MKYFLVFVLFCIPSFWALPFEVRAEQEERQFATIFPSNSVIQFKITENNRDPIIKQVIAMRQKARGFDHPVLKNSTYVIDEILRLLRHGIKGPTSYFDVILAKGDPTRELLDGIAVISRYGANIHIDLMVVAPWNLNSQIPSEGSRYSNVGKSMIEYLLIDGAKSLSLDAAGPESNSAFRAMGFLPEPNSEPSRLRLEGASIDAFLKNMRTKRAQFFF